MTVRRSNPGFAPVRTIYPGVLPQLHLVMEVILAKFVSFLGHIIDKHKNLDDPIFDSCAQGDIEHREWLSDIK